MPDCRIDGGRSPSERRALRAYSWAWRAAVPLVGGYLLWRSLRQPEYRRHWGERFGWRAAPRPDASASLPRPIWLHAVSVGETAAAVPVIRHLAARYPERPLLLTHGTPTGRQTGRERLGDLGDRLRQRYLPYDLPGAVDRFFRDEQPACGLIMETEVWPNLMAAAHVHRVPVASINGRLSGKSLVRGLRFGALIRPALAAFHTVVMQSAADAGRLQQLGRAADAVAGNLKFDQPVSEAARAMGTAWRQRFGRRPVVLAASTREGEEALLLEAWRARAVPTDAGGPSPLLLIVPRHPNRFAAVAKLMAEYLAGEPAGKPFSKPLGKPLLRRQALDDPDPELESAPLLLGDSMGEMQAWYAAADVTIMGGSILAFGSQNLIEANALGCPVVLGPSTYNFEQAAAESLAAGASVQVADAGEAVRTALAITADPVRRERMAVAAAQFAAAHRGATDRTLAALEAMLPPVS